MSQSSSPAFVANNTPQFSVSGSATPKLPPKPPAEILAGAVSSSSPGPVSSHSSNTSLADGVRPPSSISSAIPVSQEPRFNTATSRVEARRPSLTRQLIAPEFLKDFRKEDLEYLLEHPDLLDGLFEAVHPDAERFYTTNRGLNVANLELANTLLGKPNTNSEIQSPSVSIIDVANLRKQTEQLLAENHRLEAAWRDQEKKMYIALQPFSAPALYNRLARSIPESEAVSEALANSFLANVSSSPDKFAPDVTEFINSYMQERKKLHLRKEWLERWKEERVTDPRLSFR